MLGMLTAARRVLKLQCMHVHSIRDAKCQKYRLASDTEHKELLRAGLQQHIPVLGSYFFVSLHVCDTGCVCKGKKVTESCFITGENLIQYRQFVE